MSTFSNLTARPSDSVPTVTLSFKGEITVGNVSELTNQFRGALDTGGNLAIDLTTVTDIDLAGIQLLWAVERAASAAGRAMSLASPLPDALRQNFALAGLDPFAPIAGITASRS